MLSHKNPEFISQKLGKELELCNELLIHNKLSLHLGKTECILCGPKRKLKTIANFQINRNGHRLKSQNSINYLGIAIDQNLSGARPTNSIIKKVNSRLRFMYRKTNDLSSEIRRRTPTMSC